MITDGFVLLAEKKDPLLIQDRLNAYVSPAKRYVPESLQD